MDEKQLERLIQAIDRLSASFEMVARPVVIVTKKEDCAMVDNYKKRGYPIYFIDK